MSDGATDEQAQTRSLDTEVQIFLDIAARHEAIEARKEAFKLLHGVNTPRDLLDIRTVHLQSLLLSVTADGYEAFSQLSPPVQANFLELAESLATEIVETLQLVD